ncbi:MAG: Fe-S cluster biogenesis protein NfuA [Actinomycetes bacterium]
MHTETTDDLNALTWVRHGEDITGFYDTRRVEGNGPIPSGIKILAAIPGVDRIEVSPGRITATKNQTAPWPETAAKVTTAIKALVVCGDLQLAKHVDSDATLRNAVNQLLDGEVSEFAKSHGGRITIADVHDQTVTIMMDGACHNCPATRRTLQQRILKPLTPYFPDIKIIEAGKPDRESSRTTLPFPKLYRRN